MRKPIPNWPSFLLIVLWWLQQQHPRVSAAAKDAREQMSVAVPRSGLGIQQMIIDADGSTASVTRLSAGVYPELRRSLRWRLRHQAGYLYIGSLDWR